MRYSRLIAGELVPVRLGCSQSIQVTLSRARAKPDRPHQPSASARIPEDRDFLLIIGIARQASDYANSPTCPPVCQNSTVIPSLNSPALPRAIRPAIAFAVYQ